MEVEWKSPKFSVSPKRYGTSPSGVPMRPSLLILHSCQTFAMCNVADGLGASQAGNSPFGTTLEVTRKSAGIVSAAPSIRTRRRS